MKVQRFSLSPTDDGPWVRYEDYIALRTALRLAKDTLEDLAKARELELSLVECEEAARDALKDLKQTSEAN